MKMRKIMTLAVAATLAMTGFAGATANLVKTRLAQSKAVVPGYWHSDLAKCKDYAKKNGVPLIAVWSNGDLCGHCVTFEQAVVKSDFTKWMKSSGCVFYFAHSRDSFGKKDGSAYNFCWGPAKALNQFPFVRVWWYTNNGKTKKADVCAVGDTVDNKVGTAAGAKAAVNWFKSKIKGFTGTDANLPYTIAFDANLPSDYADFTGANDVAETDPVETVYTNAVKAANPFALEKYAFTGWAKTKDGAVAYTENASLSKLTTTSNATVTLFAKWAHDPYKISFEPKFESADEVDVVEMEPITAKYNESVNLKNAFVRKDWTFAGWAKTKDGAVAYKDNAAVKNLTAGAAITLYAKWTRTTYRPYYTGLSYTISTGLKGYTAKTTFPGMKWTASTGKFSGKPTKANATDPVTDAGLKVKFVKGKTTVYRNFVVVKDTLSLDGAESKTVEVTTSDDNLKYAATAISGELKKDSVTVTGLPSGMVFTASTGLITGRPTMAGTYTVTVKGTSNQGQTLSATYSFVVAEGNQLVLNGMVHVDKMFINAGEDQKISVFFLDKDDGKYEVASVVVEGIDGLSYDEQEAIVGKVDAARTYDATITVTSTDEPAAVLTQKIKIVVLPPPQQE